MKKEIYEIPTLELLRLELTNVVTASPTDIENVYNIDTDEFPIQQEPA